MTPRKSTTKAAAAAIEAAAAAAKMEKTRREQDRVAGAFLGTVIAFGFVGAVVVLAQMGLARAGYYSPADVLQALAWALAYVRISIETFFGWFEGDYVAAKEHLAAAVFALFFGDSAKSLLGAINFMVLSGGLIGSFGAMWVWLEQRFERQVMNV